ncbi:MAG: hypothetical protein H7319_11845 [Spirosoma sp.]|nr:hypothetical protein [Spirosoma sp.]
MTTIPIPVPETTVEYNQRLTEQQKDMLSALGKDGLSDPKDLLKMMDYISLKAEKRGLTPNILNELLR